MPDFPQEFGQYSLQKLIARGGMAEVYRATMPGIGGFEKTVAIKKILPHLAKDDEFIDMLVDEAQIIEQLDHTNIAQVFDLGQIDGDYYIAMEYIHGLDLSDMIRELGEHDSLLPYEHTAHILANICDGLHFAHNQTDDNGEPLNVIHRDISPHNVMISFAGDVKIIDFGVARAEDQRSDAESNSVKGKLLYMAPEQAKSSDDLDGRADLFAVGLCGYNMLTDSLPFRGENEFEVYDNVINAEIPEPKQIQPDVPQSLNDIVMKLLRRDPDERYQTGYAAQQDFQEALHDIAPAYTVNRLSNFVEQHFTHLHHEYSDAESSAPEAIPTETPVPDDRGTGERRIDSFPAKADTSDASAQQKARNVSGTADKQPVPAGQPDPPESRQQASAPSENSPSDAENAKYHGASTGELNPDELAAGQSSPDADSPARTGLTANQKLLIAIGVVATAAIATGAFLFIAPNRTLSSPTATASASGSPTSDPSDDPSSGNSEPAAGQDSDRAESPPTGTEPSRQKTTGSAPRQAPGSTQHNESTPKVVSIETVPPGADVIRNGDQIGTTPHELSVTNPDGPVDLELRKKGFSTRSVSLLPIDGAQKTFDLSATETPDPPSDKQAGSSQSDNSGHDSETSDAPETSDTDRTARAQNDDESEPSNPQTAASDDQSPDESTSSDDATTETSNNTTDDQPDNQSDEIIDPFDK